MIQRNHIRCFLISGLLLMLCLVPLADVNADVGLPPSQPGSSLSPGDYETRVQMVSEQVEIIIPEMSPEEWMATAQVTADFQMFNHGEEDESIEVWFPFGEKSDYAKGWKVIQVSDFQVWVDDQEMEVMVNESDEWLIIWAHWPVTFPAGETVEIQVSYTITENLVGGGPYNFHGFYYILETGAGWDGVIEEAHITVKAPYPLGALDDFLGGPTFLARPDGYTVSGNDVNWALQDLEPTENDNLEIYLLHQDIQQHIIDARQALQIDVNDWEASYQLAEGIHAWLNAQPSLVSGDFIDTTPDLHALEELATARYQQALDHSPPDLSLYLKALAFFRWYPSWINSRDLQDYYYRAVLHFPDNKQLRENYQREIEEGNIGEGKPPSATPLPTATLTPTVPPTTEIIDTPVGSETSNPLYFLLGLALFFFALLLLMFGFWRMRRGGKPGDQRVQGGRARTQDR